MNAPIPRILIESTWRGRLFGAQWRPAIGGSLDVLEPATGAVITRVGATAVIRELLSAPFVALRGPHERRGPLDTKRYRHPAQAV